MSPVEKRRKALLDSKSTQIEPAFSPMHSISPIISFPKLMTDGVSPISISAILNAPESKPRSKTRSKTVKKRIKSNGKSNKSRTMPIPIPTKPPKPTSSASPPLGTPPYQLHAQSQFSAKLKPPNPLPISIQIPPIISNNNIPLTKTITQQTITPSITNRLNCNSFGITSMIPLTPLTPLQPQVYNIIPKPIMTIKLPPNNVNIMNDVKAHNIGTNALSSLLQTMSTAPVANTHNINRQNQKAFISPPNVNNNIQLQQFMPIPLTTSTVLISQKLQQFKPVIDSTKRFNQKLKHKGISSIVPKKDQKKLKKKRKTKRNYPRTANIRGGKWHRHYSAPDRKYYYLLTNEAGDIISKEWDPWNKYGLKAPWMDIKQAWYKFTDPKQKKVYFYNYQTQQSTFNRPEGFESDPEIDYDSADGDHN